MIKCKEDLINTYIENDHGELRDLYIKKAIELGVKTCDGGRFKYLLDKVAIGVRDWGCGAQLEWNNREFGDAKRLTLSDLKPRTRTEYEKVTESIFDLRDEFERGELYTKGRGAVGDFFKKITTEYELITFASCGLYRKAEKEIDWRDEVFEFTKSINGKVSFADGFSVSKMSEEQFLELCRVALRANGEIE